MRRLTTEEFIERARGVHGDRYDYSDTRYVNAVTKLTIRCRTHGPWSQLPGNHLAGKGCRPCAGLVRLSTAEFIRRSREVHGTKYDYSKVEYVNNKTRVRIICSTHGEFLQLPTEHYLAGSGCNRCAAEERGLKRRLTTEEFIERANTVHGNRYDYSQVEYQHNFEAVTIVCPEHGPFRQVPKNHIRGRGCPLCGGGQQLTTAQFVKRAKEVHGDRYDYEQVEYLNAKENVSIICSEHGAFLQRPVDHLSGHGCQRCAAILRGQKTRLTTGEFIRKAEAVHGDRYDYSLVEYVTNETKVTIVCPNHGGFLQSPGSHLSGRGCNECWRESASDTTEVFIQKARNVHGDRYDYSLAEYVSQNTKVTIICPDHGPFLQSPGGHIHQRSGCQECAGKAPLTTERFIEKAKAAHGDRYDYSQVRCEGNKKDVTIVCPEHGPFRQLPTNHYRGKGCPDCGGSKQHTTQSFIEAAQAIHGVRYDYSQVEYDMNKAPVTIGCRIHGPFSQVAAVHLRGNGCPDCGGNKKLTSQSFIDKAQAVHGDHYDYSQVDYERAHAIVTIICPDHGSFEQSPTSHLGGSGCDECGRLAAADARRKTTEQFIAEASAVHGDRYDYSLVEYVSSAAKVTIICSDHGPFEQTPSEHLVGSGCAECGRLAAADARRKTTEQFIAEASAVHGDRYDYSLVEYLSSIEKVTIICPDHGPFEQAPNGHLGGRGCADCADSGFNPNEPGLLYYVAVTTDGGDTRYKIGITNRTVEERFYGPDLARIRIVKTWQFAVGRVAAEREAEILYQYAGERYYGPEILLRAGNTELFTHDILGLDKPDDGHGQSAVDEGANLISKQVQSNFDF